MSQGNQQDLFAAIRREIQGAVGHAYGKISQLEQAVQLGAQERRAFMESLQAFNTTMQSLSTSRAGANPSLAYIENIPGRRVPFDYTVDIPIGANDTGVQQGTITISQEAPFVAVGRYATFLSQYTYQYVDPETEQVSSFNARSYGRYRPVHSAMDVFDGQLRSQVIQSVAFPGDASPHMLSPSNGAPFRTMQGDFRIQMLNAGSAYPRQNNPLPSSLWVKQINDPFQFGALDFFERGEVITFNILPQHLQNPSYGNMTGYGTGGVWPFSSSGWDYLEGINDPEVVGETSDPILRAPNGILTIGLWGYRIIQPVGVGSY